MKKCPQCGSISSDDEDVCGVCGSSLEGIGPTSLEQATQVNDQPPSLKVQPDKGGPTASVEGFFRKCPQCGQRFHVKLESKKLVSVDVLKEDLPVGPYGPSRRRLAPTTPATLDVEEFRYNYKCNRCGHEWSEGRLEESREG